MSLIKCKECGDQVSKKAKTCPHCGAELKKERKNIGWLSAIIIIVVFAWLIGYLTESYETYNEAAQQKKTNQKNLAYFSQNRESILSSIKKQIDQGQYKSALIQINTYKISGDPELTKYFNIAREKLLLNELKALPAAMTKENLDRYQELLRIDPNNEKYKNKVAYYQKKIDAKKTEAAARVSRLGEKPTLSYLDGSYLEVKKYLNKVAHDPDSIEFENCSKIYYMENGWLVRCTFRGKNSLGAMVSNTHWFRIRHGSVVQQYEADAFSL